MAAEVQRVLSAANEDEYAFMLQGADKVHLGWMPFQLADFVAIMTECMIETEGIAFLEVGSGIGTKCQVASYLFGLSTYGIEYNETLATVAKAKNRGPVWVGDALDYPHSYSDHDIVWMYRPFRDRELERKLEERIYAEMKPGAIFAGGQLEHFPDGNSWVPIIDDREIRRGAWKKVR
jgi:hypothetical protein